MYDIIETIQSLIKNGRIRIDNNVFTLHYRLTVIFLLGFSLVIGSRKYFGDPIDCTTSNEQVKPIADSFCWFNSYIIVPRVQGNPYKGENQRYRPVINNAAPTLEELSKDDPNSYYKAYFLHSYQWIEGILFLQALLFFLPRYLWRYCWELGKVKTLTQNFTLVSLKPDDDKQKLGDIIRFMKQNKFALIEYAWKFVFCEVLNFANVLTQFLIVQRTFSLGWDVLLEDFLSSNSNVNAENPLNLVFPNFAKCEVPYSSASKHLFSHEFCVLPVNVFITKIYIFLWFYFFGLSVLSGLMLMYRTVTVFSFRIRFFLLKRTGQGMTDDRADAIRDLSYAEWFLLRLVGKNMDPITFENLLIAYNDDLVASGPTFSLVRNNKIYNADHAVMQA